MAKVEAVLSWAVAIDDRYDLESGVYSGAIPWASNYLSGMCLLWQTRLSPTRSICSGGNLSGTVSSRVSQRHRCRGRPDRQRIPPRPHRPTTTICAKMGHMARYRLSRMTGSVSRGMRTLTWSGNNKSTARWRRWKGRDVRLEDVVQLSPLGFAHTNIPGGDPAIGWATPDCRTFGRNGSDVLHSSKGIVSVRRGLNASRSSYVFGHPCCTYT